MIEYGIKFSMSSRSLIFQESRVSLGRTLPRQLVWERVDYLLIQRVGLLCNCFTTAKRFSACSFCFYFGYISFSRFPRCSPQKNRNALNLSPHFKLRQKNKSYNAPAKMQLKGKCIRGFEVLLKPPKWKLIMFYSFSVLLLCKKQKKKVN